MEFLTSNDPRWRCLRTVVQGALGVVVAMLPQVIGAYELDPTLSACIVALVMAVLSPVMAMLGAEDEEEAEWADSQ